MDFESWNITDLIGFLKERGVTYSKTKKHELVDLCRLAVENNIEVDPNFFKDNIIDESKSKLKYFGRTIPDPKS